MKRVIYNSLNCIDCCACSRLCESSALSGSPGLGYKLIRVDLCTGCRKCINGCVFKCLSISGGDSNV